MLTAVAWATGGFREYKKPPRTLAPNATVNQGRFAIKAIAARTGLIDAGFGPKKYLLAVRLQVTNLGKESAGINEFQRGILASARPGGRQNEVGEAEILVNGGSESYLHPRLPASVDATWSLPNGTKLPQVIVSVRMWTYVDDPFGGSDPYWMMDKKAPTVASVTLPVRQGATS